jgi:uncharacterized membrane-anchored protein
MTPRCEPIRSLGQPKISADKKRTRFSTRVTQGRVRPQSSPKESFVRSRRFRTSRAEVMLRAASRAASFASRRAALSSPDKALFADAWAPLAPCIARRARDAPARRAAFAADASSHPLLSDHPKRLEVASVLHARPWQRIAIPSLVSSVTTTQKYPVLVDGVSCPMAGVVDPATAYDRDYAHLKLLCDHFIVAPPPHGTTFFTTNIGPLSMRWERHTEVCTYTFVREIAGGDETEILANPFGEAHVASSLVPKPWLRSMPGGVVSATHVSLVEGDPADGWGDTSGDTGGDLHTASRAPSSPARRSGGASSAEQETGVALLKKVKPLFNHSEVITGSSLDRGRFRAYSDWRVHGDGFGRIAIHHRPDDARAFVSSAAGKATQRVIELDKYRVLALMGLPFAQALSRTVDTLNEEMMRVMDAIGDAEKPSAEAPNPNLRRELLSRLTALASTAQKLSAVAHDRFAASAAYAELVSDRVRYLTMGKIPAVPGMASFVLDATEPGARTCAAVRRRLDKLAHSAHLAANVMQTSLTVEQHARSNESLARLRATATAQLTMQHNVEGLSTVALTYYSLGVLGYAAKATAGTGALPVAPEVALGAAIPLVWMAVSAAVRRMKRAAMMEGEGGGGGGAPRG